MSQSNPDHPQVMLFPPFLLLATVGLSIALQIIMPIQFLVALDRTWRIGSGVATLIVGVAIGLVACRTLIRRGTNISPLRPTTALATEGVFNWTRNPIYVGGTVVLIGFAFVCALDWLLLLVGPSMLVLHFTVVLREEKYLARKFYEEYRRYTTRVPRYLWF